MPSAQSLLRASVIWLVWPILLLGGCVTAPPAPKPVENPRPQLQLRSWPELPGWADQDFLAVWPAFLLDCAPLKKQAEWRPVCDAAARLAPLDNEHARAFFEHWLAPHQLVTDAGRDTGLITGYYEPLLFGSRARSARFRFPVYGEPADLLSIDLASVYPELKNYRLRGRLDGRKVVPYYDRAEIEAGRAPLQGRELLWVDDAIDLFFLQIQGSGRVQLDDGGMVRLTYADQNGHPYVSIGRKLVEQGELTVDQASMQGIKQWGEHHPDRLGALLHSNASYVFFRELPGTADAKLGPPGALGIPLTPGHSLAVDPRAVPLGTPVYLATTWPDGNAPLNRLMLAQDTGGAIKGAIRADLFWGFGEEAAQRAGRMRQAGRLWVLLPQGRGGS